MIACCSSDLVVCFLFVAAHFVPVFSLCCQGKKVLITHLYSLCISENSLCFTLPAIFILISCECYKSKI